MAASLQRRSTVSALGFAVCLILLLQAAPARAQFTPPPLPNPADNTGVNAEASGQAGATFRAAQNQLHAIEARIQSLHGSFETAPADGDTAANIAPQQAKSQDTSALMQYVTSERRADTNATPLMFESTGLSSFRKALHDRGTTIWIGGLFDQGSFGNDSTGYDFRGASLTAGLDGKLSDRVIAGVTFGYARDFTDYSDPGSETNTSSFTVSAYGTYKATETAYIDIVGGYSDVDIDNHRWETGNNTLLSGDRDGRSWFGSVALSNEWRTAQSLVSPYLQASVISNRVDHYSEAATSIYALTYDDMSFTNVGLSAGVYASYDFEVRGGILRPFAKADFTHNTDSSSTQGLNYSDLGSSTRTFTDIDIVSENVLTGDLGVSYMDADGNQASIWGRASAGSNDFSAQSLGVSLRAKF